MAAPETDDFEQRCALGAQLLGARIRAAREAAGLPRREVAERSGVSFHTIYGIERGHRLSSLPSLDRIGAVLGLTATDLMEGVYPWDSVGPPEDLPRVSV